MLPDRVGHTHEPNELPQISMANCRVCSPLRAPVAVDVTGHTGWPHIHGSSLWRTLWPSSTRSCLWCFIRAHSCMESAQFITGGGRMARDSQRSGRSLLQMCSSAGQGAEASLQLPSTQRPPRFCNGPLTPHCSGAPSMSHQISESTHHFQTPNASGSQGSCVLPCTRQVHPRGSTHFSKVRPWTPRTSSSPVCQSPPRASGCSCSSQGCASRGSGNFIPSELQTFSVLQTL